MTRLRAWTLHLWPLALFLVVVALVVAILQWKHFNPQHDPVDEWLLLIMALTGFVGLGIMVVRTEDWTIRAIGVFGYIAAASLLFVLFERAAIWDDQFTSLQLDVVRALFLVGAPLWLIGQFRFIGGGIATRWRRRG